MSFVGKRFGLCPSSPMPTTSTRRRQSDTTSCTSGRATDSALFLIYSSPPPLTRPSASAASFSSCQCLPPLRATRPYRPAPWESGPARSIQLSRTCDGITHGSTTAFPLFDSCARGRGLWVACMRAGTSRELCPHGKKGPADGATLATVPGGREHAPPRRRWVRVEPI